MKELILFFMISLSTLPAHAGTWSLQISGGTSYNFRSPLTIEQHGETIRHDARYSTRPWDDSPYYAVRIAAWRKNSSWELELLHHKLYLEHPPAAVERFEISHGFNLLTVNRAWRCGGFIYRLGLGAVIAYPEIITAGGQKTNSRYQIAGPTAQAAIEKRFRFFKNFFAAVEGKFTASYAQVDIDGGDATIGNLAVHGLFGIGMEF